MFDLTPLEMTYSQDPAPVLFLSGPLNCDLISTAITRDLGSRAASWSYRDVEHWRQRALTTPGGAHLVAHGTAAYHALQLARHAPHAVQSVTLIDPDILRSLVDLAPCPQFRDRFQLSESVSVFLREGDRVRAAEQVATWWMRVRPWDRRAARPQCLPT